MRRTVNSLREVQSYILNTLQNLDNMNQLAVLIKLIFALVIFHLKLLQICSFLLVLSTSRRYGGGGEQTIHGHMGLRQHISSLPEFFHSFGTPYILTKT